MTQWQWDLRRVNHLARVDAYYGGHARVKHESLQVPQQAYFKPQPPAVVAVDDQRQSKAQQRASRKRKREQVRHEELIAAGKFVPVNEALQRALADVHRELLCDEAGIAALQPVLASCSDSNGIPAQHESHQLSVGSLHSNATDEVQIAHAKDGEGVLLPAQSSFILGDVRKLRSGGVTPAALGQFQLIVMDPPWENKSVARSNKYATFHHTELLKIDVPALADPDECVLGIWVTNRPQYTAFILETLLPQWGFTLHDTWFWLKVCADGDLVTPIESSHRLPFEKMIVAYRCADPEQRRALEKRLGEDPKLLLSIPLRHSWKPPPECFFYESMVTKDARKLELFARELRPRWTSVGNEVLKFQAASLFDFVGANAQELAHGSHLTRINSEEHLADLNGIRAASVPNNMSESSTKRADRSLRAKPKKKSPSAAANARTTSDQRGGGNSRARNDHVSPFSEDSDDEYDRSKVEFTSETGAAERGDYYGDLLDAATGTRVKFLWKDIKDEDEDDGNADRRRSKSAQSKSARMRKPKSPPAPRSIQKRAEVESTPASLPAPVAAFAHSGDSHSDLLQRILKWEEKLKASSLYDALTPVRINHGAGSESLSMTFRRACAEIIKKYPQSASKMSIDKRLWASWYKEIDAIQSSLRSGASSSNPRNATGRAPSPGKSKGSSSDHETAATRKKLQTLLTSCNDFYALLVRDLQQLHQRQQQHTSAQDQQLKQAQAIRFSLHMSLVALGDTARYAQKVLPNHHGHDWSIAQQHYESALQFLPFNGKVYNQLALLAMNERQGIKSVYLYARSLACETPFSSRENLVHAVGRGRAKRVDEQIRCTSIAEVGERVGALLLTCLHALVSRERLEAEDIDGDEDDRRQDTWDTAVSNLLSGLRFYLETCAALLLAGERLDVVSVRSDLNQIVCVLIFFVHHAQMPNTSVRHLSRSDFDQELFGWRQNADIDRLLALGFAVITCLMKECAKAVLTAEYMVIAEDLMNMLLSPINIFLDWLRRHPWFLKSSFETSPAATDFLSCTVNLLFSISASMLADRILDEDMSEMGRQQLPEDRELRGFLPIKPAAFSDEETTHDLDESGMHLDVRMCRVLSVSNDFIKLNGKVPTSEVSWKLQERATTGAGASSQYDLIVFVPSVESTIPEYGANVNCNSSKDEEIATLSDLLPKSSSVGSPLSASTVRRGSPPLRRSPRDAHSSSSPPSTATGPQPEEPSTFAAVMAIGADKKLYDALANPKTAEQKCLIVIDAPNVAMRHGFHKKFSSKGIRLAFDYFLARDHRVVGFLPDYLVRQESVEERRQMVKDGIDVPAAKIPNDVGLLMQMVDEGLLVPTPAQDYDDSYCIQYAGMYDGCVVTNDLYRDHVENMTGPRERKFAMRSWLVAHRISFTWVRDEFLPNPNFRYPKSK